MFRLDDVHVAFRERPILRGLSLALGAGCFAAVIGPNGAGKSTLLKAISGEITPTRGAVLLEGTPLPRLGASALARRRAVVPQSALLSFPFKVHEVVALGVSVPGFAIAHPTEPVQRAIDVVGVGHLQHRPYTQLSGGERQQVQIARALCQLFGSPAAPEETLLLLDEPTSSLDLPHQLHLMRVARHQARAGRLVIAVLHDVNLAMTWADTVIALHDGALCALGTPRDLMTEALLEKLYGEKLRLTQVPGSDIPAVLPQAMGTD